MGRAPRRLLQACRIIPRGGCCEFAFGGGASMIDQQLCRPCKGQACRKATLPGRSRDQRPYGCRCEKVTGRMIEGLHRE